MRNPKISAARSARAEYRQKLKRLELGASIARNIYAESLKELAIDKFLKLDLLLFWGNSVLKHQSSVPSKPLYPLPFPLYPLLISFAYHHN